VTSTVGDSAFLIGNGDAWYPYSKEGREKFIESAISILTNRELWKSWSEKGFKNTEKYSWKNVALRWNQLFKS